MWEAEAAPDRADALLAFVLECADASAEVYRSEDDRIVVVDPTGSGVPDPPAELVTRPPQAWPFHRVR